MNVPELIMDSLLPLNITSYVVHPTHDCEQDEEVQRFCEHFSQSQTFTSQTQCHQALKQCLGDRFSIFHMPLDSQVLHPLSKAQILVELHTISCYIFHVLDRGLTCAVPFMPRRSDSLHTQDHLNEDEMLRFVTLVQACAHETTRTLLCYRDGNLILRELSQLQTRAASCNMGELLLSCWTGADFYTRWYRCGDSASYVNYETFRVMHNTSSAIFASVLEELRLDDEEEERIPQEG
jgi:hypothetical protein